MSGSWARRSREWVFAAWLAASALSIAAGFLSANAGRSIETYAALALSGLVYAAAGAVAAFRQPRNPIGWMLILSSALTAGLVTLRYALPVTLPLNLAVGTQVAVIPLVFVVLSFPSGRITDNASRWLLAAMVVVGVVGGVLELISLEPGLVVPPAACAPCTSNPLRLLDPELYSVFQNLNALAFIGFAAAVVVLVAIRWRMSRGLTRAAVTPVVAGGVVLAALYVSLFALALTTGDVPALAGPLLLMTRLLIPIGLVVLFLRFYSARAAVARSLMRIGRGSSVGVIEDALRSSLGDPSVRVARWSPAANAYVDRSDQLLDLPHVARDQAVLSIGEPDRPIAAVVHDSALDADAELLTVIAEAVEHSLDVADLRDDLTARGGDVGRLPTGRVTLLFGDIEQSTVLLRQLGERWADVLEKFRDQVRAATHANRGEIVDLRADECFVVFTSPTDALAAARMLIDRLDSVSWPGDATVRVRIGLHTGEPELTSGGYVGMDVHHAARVMAKANGGQIVVSQAFVDAIQVGPGASVELRSLGDSQLRGFETSEPLFEVASLRNN